MSKLGNPRQNSDDPRQKSTVLFFRQKCLLFRRIFMKDTIDALLCYIRLPVCLLIIDPHNRAAKKNTSHGNEVLPQDTKHRIQRSHYQRGSLCQDSAGNRILTTVKRRNLKWYGNISRSSSLAKTILQGTVKGEKRQGRQKKSLEDNIREWTNLEFAKSQMAVENRKMEETGCGVICGVPTTPKVNG